MFAESVKQPKDKIIQQVKPCITARIAIVYLNIIHMQNHTETCHIMQQILPQSSYFLYSLQHFNTHKKLTWSFGSFDSVVIGSRTRIFVVLINTLYVKIYGATEYQLVETERFVMSYSFPSVNLNNARTKRVVLNKMNSFISQILISCLKPRNDGNNYL